MKIIKYFVIALSLSIIGTSVNAAPMSTMDMQADQSTGQYAPMNMGYAGFNSLGMTQAAWLDPMQNLGEGQSKPAYSKYYWSQDLVLPIRVREGMITLVNFPDWELIEDVYIGDNSTFDAQISGPNAVLLYPKKGSNVGVDTNLIIFGRSGNRYVFYMKSEGVNSERLTNSIIDIEVVGDEASKGGSAPGNGSKFSGGSAAKSAASTRTKSFQKNDWIKDVDVTPEDFKFDIEIYIPNPDDVVIAPERVWRDKVFTYVDLGEKALNMTQRPIVTLIVERIEVPVGFRTTGPNNRLIIVEGIGDMVLRNGKRMVCLKLRKDPSDGLNYASYADTGNQWDVPAPIPSRNMGGKGDGRSFDGDRQAPRNNPYSGAMSGKYDYSRQAGNQPMNNPTAPTDSSMVASDKYSYGSGFADENTTISIELGTNDNVETLEVLWDDLSNRFSSVIGNYEPFFSVDTPADGQGKELFHLRVGPVRTLEEGDSVCGNLGRNGVFCSVVRTQ